MKKLIITLLICGLTGIYSCDSFLDITPESEYTDKTFYLTPTDFKTAITAVYSELQGIFGQGNSGYMNSIIYRGDEVRNSNNISRFMDAATEGGWKNSWTTLWGIIYRSNKILDRIDKVDFPNEDDKNHIKGEALALRGFSFLQLAWCWGGAPLITQELSLAETYKVPRASQEATYAQAEADFLEAFELLPASWDSSNIGRVTKYAAAGMLGRLYMYTHKYTEAEKYLAEVIAQEGTLYAMEANYGDCFDDAKDNGKERVWEVQYLGGATSVALGVSQQFSSWFIPSSLNVRTDGPLLYGVTFTGPSGSVGVSESLWGEGVYEEGDRRREFSIVTGLMTSYSEPNYDRYYCRKFLKASSNPPTAINAWGTNLPILRYTDVKMMYAEALNEINYSANISTKILPILNEVRNRAGLAPLTTEDLPDKETTFEYIVHDRFLEFCFEGLRWPDLIRWGKVEEVMEKHFSLKDEGFNTTTNIPTYTVKKRNLLAPIPYSEIVNYNDKNVMWQNEGY